MKSSLPHLPDLLPFNPSGLLILLGSPMVHLPASPLPHGELLPHLLPIIVPPMAIHYLPLLTFVCPHILTHHSIEWQPLLFSRLYTHILPPITLYARYILYITRTSHAITAISYSSTGHLCPHFADRRRTVVLKLVLVLWFDLGTSAPFGFCLLGTAYRWYVHTLTLPTSPDSGCFP